jgi:ketosteroid isomerase-like protein
MFGLSKSPKGAASPKACMAAFIDALLRRDIDAALALMTDDVVIFYSNGTAIWGKDAFAANMTANWKLISDYKYSTLDSIWLEEADTAAVVIYNFAWSGVAGGNAVGASGRGTRAFRKDRGGWRLAHEHLTTGEWGRPGK